MKTSPFLEALKLLHNNSNHHLLKKLCLDDRFESRGSKSVSENKSPLITTIGNKMSYVACAIGIREDGTIYIPKPFVAEHDPLSLNEHSPEVQSAYNRYQSWRGKLFASENQVNRRGVNRKLRGLYAFLEQNSIR